MSITEEERAISKDTANTGRRREKNEEQTRKWIEVVLPKCERATAGNVNLEEILGSGAKPDSKPPIPDHALDLLEHEDNRHAASRINPALQWLAENQGHLHFVTRLVMQEPALPRKWAEDSAEASLYRKAVTKLEEYIEWRFPGEKLRVAVDPKDEPVESKMAARDQERRRTAEDAYPILANKVWQKMEDNRSKTAAVHEVADAEDTSPARVWRALAHVEEESA